MWFCIGYWLRPYYNALGTERALDRFCGARNEVLSGYAGVLRPDESGCSGALRPDESAWCYDVNQARVCCFPLNLGLICADRMIKIC